MAGLPVWSSPPTTGTRRKLTAAPWYQPRRKDEQVRVLGPAEAPIAVVRGRHRFRVLVKAPRAFDLSVYLRQWLSTAPKPRGNVRLEVDIDPQSFF